jgi:hypothetical protein
MGFPEFVAILRLFGVRFRIHDTIDFPLLWEDDRTIIKLVADTSIFSWGELVRFNRYRHYKKFTA